MLVLLGYTSKMFPIHKEILGFLDVALAGYLSFSQFSFFFFESKPRLYFQIFPNSQKIWETGIFEVPSYSHLLSLKPFSYSETMRWKQDWQIRSFAEKISNFHSFNLKCICISLGVQDKLDIVTVQCSSLRRFINFKLPDN